MPDVRKGTYLFGDDTSVDAIDSDQSSIQSQDESILSELDHLQDAKEVLGEKLVRCISPPTSSPSKNNLPNLVPASPASTCSASSASSNESINEELDFIKGPCAPFVTPEKKKQTRRISRRPRLPSKASDQDDLERWYDLQILSANDSSRKMSRRVSLATREELNKVNRDVQSALMRKRQSI